MMRKDTILVVLGVAAVAAITYFVLETTVPQSEPSLAPVVPRDPPVVEEQAAEKAPESERVDPTQP
jgi:hypothetical protein